MALASPRQRQPCPADSPGQASSSSAQALPWALGGGNCRRSWTPASSLPGASHARVRSVLELHPAPLAVLLPQERACSGFLALAASFRMALGARCARGVGSCSMLGRNTLQGWALPFLKLWWLLGVGWVCGLPASLGTTSSLGGPVWDTIRGADALSPLRFGRGRGSAVGIAVVPGRWCWSSAEPVACGAQPPASLTWHQDKPVRKGAGSAEDVAPRKRVQGQHHQ